jgi:hypothetical protein
MTPQNWVLSGGSTCRVNPELGFDPDLKDRKDRQPEHQNQQLHLWLLTTKLETMAHNASYKPMISPNALVC